MKTINRVLLAMTALIILSTSCKKESASLPQPSYDDKVTSSEWFSVSNWAPGGDSSGSRWLTHTNNVPEITDDLLKNGKVLVFAKGFEMMPRVLPFICNQTAIGIEKQPGNLKFKIVFLGPFQLAAVELHFKYVLIPPGKLATNTNLDYNDYEQVCTYYNMPK